MKTVKIRLYINFVTSVYHKENTFLLHGNMIQATSTLELVMNLDLDYFMTKSSSLPCQQRGIVQNKYFCIM